MKKQNIQKRDVEAELLSGTFDYLVESGLENFSMRELCKHTGISVGSIYYWFDNKDELVISAAQYGYSLVFANIFDYVFETIKDFEDFFEHSLNEIERFFVPMRAIYQIATSPYYGKKIRDNNDQFNLLYDQYVMKLAEFLNLGFDVLKPLVHIYMAAVTEYVICENKEAAKIQMQFIYKEFKKLYQG